MILKLTVKLHIALLGLSAFLQSSSVMAQTSNALERASTSLESNILQGNWRVIIVAICIMAAGFLFATGRLAWYWCLAIIIGASLIAGAKTFAEWIFSWWS